MAISVNNKTSCNAKENILFLAPCLKYAETVMKYLCHFLTRNDIRYTAGDDYIMTDYADIRFVWCDPLEWTTATFAKRDAVFGRKELVEKAKESYFEMFVKTPKGCLDDYLMNLVRKNTEGEKSNKPTTYIPGIKNVHFNDPMTIVLWEDGTKTIVKCQDGDVYSEELGLAMCIAKKALGNKGNFNETFKKWVPVESAYPKVLISTSSTMTEEFQKRLMEKLDKLLNDSTFKKRGMIEL